MILNKSFVILSVVLVSLVILSPITLHAQDDDVISPERPGFTNPPSVVPVKHLQIESGVYYESDKLKDTELKTDRYLYPTTLLRYGVMKNIELRLQVDVAGTSNSDGSTKLGSISGLNPIIVGAKIYLFEQKKSRPEAAMVFSLTLPYFGKEEFQPQYPAPSVGLYFQNTLNKKVSIGYNAGLQWNGNDANPTAVLTFSPTYNFTKKLSGFAEIYGNFQKGAIPDVRCDAGVAFLALKNLQLDISAGPGIAGETTNYFISGGISYRIPK